MKILYTSDLHGNIKKYAQLYTAAKSNDVAMVINGGDMLPAGKSLFRQDKFIKTQLDNHFKKFEDLKIHYLCFPGNDDLIIFDPLLNSICQKYEYIHNIAQEKILISNYEFIGMNWVCDYPFRLKDRCRMDDKHFIFGHQYGAGVLSTPDGWKNIKDWVSFAQGLPTIEDELKKLPKPQKPEKAIYVIHMPPASVGLDVCHHGAKVGSKALYSFLKSHQPLLSLHGHIHESPSETGIWKTEIGKTICIQPGQLDSFTYVIIDTETMIIKRNS